MKGTVGVLLVFLSFAVAFDVIEYDERAGAFGNYYKYDDSFYANVEQYVVQACQQLTAPDPRRFVWTPLEPIDKTCKEAWDYCIDNSAIGAYRQNPPRENVRLFRSCQLVVREDGKRECEDPQEPEEVDHFVSPPFAFPYSALVLVISPNSNGETSYCTGAVVGENTVLVVGDCLEGASEVPPLVLTNYHDYSWNKAYITKHTWTSSSGDYGLLKMKTTCETDDNYVSMPIGYHTGFFSMSSLEGEFGKLNNLGYQPVAPSRNFTLKNFWVGSDGSSALEEVAGSVLVENLHVDTIEPDRKYIDANKLNRLVGLADDSNDPDAAVFADEFNGLYYIYCISETEVCEVIEGSCGDGIVEGDEECDGGYMANQWVPNRCRPTCVLPACGDGVLDGKNNEECDTGEEVSDEPDAECRTDCTWQRCGDGIKDKNEMCDNGDDNSMEPNACRPGCLHNFCGDGVVDDQPFMVLYNGEYRFERYPEQCDDGISNGLESSSCSHTCQLKD